MTNPGTGSELPPFLNNAAAAQALMDFLGVKDRSQRFELINAVLPVAVVQEPPITLNERPASGSISQNGGVTNSQGQIFNPAGSGVNLQVDAVFVTLETAGLCTLRQHDTALADNSTEKLFRDRTLTGLPIGQVRTVDAALVGGIMGRFSTLADSAYPLPLDFLIEPGQGIHIAVQTTTIRLDLMWFWSEIDR